MQMDKTSLAHFFEHYAQKLRQKTSLSFKEAPTNQIWNQTAFETKVREKFHQVYGFSQAYLDEHFALPPDYAAFLAQGWSLLSELNNADDCLFYTFEENPHLGDISSLIAEQEGQAGDLWLNIARSGDRHEYFIACHKNQPNFGRVVDCNDACIYWDYAKNELYVDSFMEFLILEYFYWRSPLD